MKWVLAVVGLGTAVIAGLAVVLWTGAYNVAANDPHWDVTVTVLDMARRRSVAVRSAVVRVPPLNDPAWIEEGQQTYEEMCRACHVGVGTARSSFAMGLYPAPPVLSAPSFQASLSDGELYWIVRNGFKMTGMPAFEVVLSDEEVWQLVAFVRTLPGLTRGGSLGGPGRTRAEGSP